MPPTPFGIKLNDEPILSFTHHKDGAISLSIEGALNIPGIVSMYEEHTVRKKIGYNIREWYSLSPMERAFEVAHERIANMIEFKQSEKDIARAKSKSG